MKELSFFEFAMQELGNDNHQTVTLYLRENQKKEQELRKAWEKYCEEYGKWQKTAPIDERFLDQQLIEHIWRELDKKHKQDHKQKIVLFLVALSAELAYPKQRVSAALKGDSSSGKDNLVDSVFEHFPKNDTIKWTGASPAAFRDAVLKGKRFALSEVNKAREGANSELTEKLKQLAEGGISDILKEKIGSKWINVEINSPQKTVIYSTTESAIDDELHTRFIVLPIYSSVEKNKIVLKNTFKAFSNPEMFKIYTKKKSWIAQGISALDGELYVYIPYLNLFQEEIEIENGEKKFLFDLTKERVKRDVKRIIAIASTITWLYQKQRRVYVEDGIKFCVAEPSDFITALILCADFFDLTYSGLDHRVQKTLDTIKEFEGNQATEITETGYSIEYADWVLRNSVQEHLGITLNTIKEHIKTLEQYGLVQTFYLSETRRVILSTKKAPINSPINDLSIPVSVSVVDRLLTGWLTGKALNTHYEGKKINPIRLSFLSSPHTCGQIDRCQIDMSISPEIYEGETVLNPCPHGNYEDEKCLFCEQENEKK